MTEATESARTFVKTLAALAERLADRDIVIRRLDCDWSGSGSWALEVSRGVAETERLNAIRREALAEAGPEVFSVTWDSRERYLELRSTPTGLLTKLNTWKQLDARAAESHEAAVTLAEEWLAARLGSR